MNWDDTIVEASLTDTGMRRSNNQDSHAIVRASSVEVWRQRGHLYMVADGMGAHAVGELASKMACDNIPFHYNKSKNVPASEAITKAYREVGTLIHSRASANREFQGMGTTCTTLLLLREGALIAHVGDSRAYRIRQGRIDQLSFDHSMVWELRKRKLLPPDESNIAVPKNVITRSLGPDPKVQVDIEGPLAVEANDVFLLCSDGLSGPVTDPELGVFAENFHPKDACRYLLNLANLRGGLDNITVVILRLGDWVEPGLSKEPAAPSKPVDQADGKGAPGWFARLFSGRSKRSASVTVEDHPYRTAPCPIDRALLDRLADLTRRAQQHALEHAWPVDWTAFARFRRDEAESVEASEDRKTLEALGEMVVALGQAARFHRKAGGHAGVS